MTKRTRLFTLAIVIGLAAWWFFREKGSGTSDKRKTAFAVENTDNITKIFLTNRMEGHLLLEKRNGVWMVNGKYEAFKPTMEFFLNETLKKIRVRGPVPAEARANIISSMATTATKVEIYQDGELSKVYYVGQPTNDLSGTYMYLEGSKDPYITHIPGFDGFLSSRYPVIEKEWVSKVIFDYKPDAIQSIDVQFPENTAESFTISRKANPGDFDITMNDNAPAGQINYAAVKSYFGLFEFKYCEGFVEFPPSMLDSMLRSTPYCVVTVTGTDKKERKLRVYRRKSGDRDHSLYDSKGNRLAYDPSRFNAIIDNETRVAVIQDLVFGPIMVHYSDFFVKTERD